ncbi:DUF418 domain-containing protein [Pedobacter sp. L105]|uniref:DUF418 domain-containing protein n=1 Tax=Pedobacter sp. L105 TaxID=1641871 RepID=UPI00131E45AE|nr:DUF418 domain-containing protein [Pedobacter sp. L105]
MDTIIVQPIQANQRTVIVDILRGWALLGVVLGNYSDFFGFGKTFVHPPELISTVLEYFNFYFFAAKSWTLLSVLFGYGFAIVMNNVATKGNNPVLFFLKRMFWLFVIAFINSSFWFGDILKDYALLGLLLLFFHRCTAKTAFRLSIILIVIVPFLAAYLTYLNLYDVEKAFNSHVLPLFYSHNWLDVFLMNLKGTYYTEMLSPSYAIIARMVMFACMLLGFSAQRINFFDRLAEFKKQLKTIFWLCLALAILLNAGLLYALSLKFQFTYFKPRYLIILSTMLTIASGICLLYINGKLKGFFHNLQAMGKMTLTNYIVQNVIAAFLFLNIGLGIFNTMPFWFYIGIALVIYILQLFFSKWWLTYYNYGPIEWIWRQLTYGKRLPIKKKVPS